MDFIYLNLIFYPFFIIAIFSSIVGYGIVVNNMIFKDNIDLDLKNLIFIKGLLFSGIIFIFLNFFFPISDNLSYLFIFGGCIIYFFYFIKNQYKEKEIVFILFVLILSFFYSFYAGVSDDYHYHYETIKNYKNRNLFEILHHRMISYNSHWLFLTSIYSISYFSSSLFIISSLFFSITIFDLLNLARKSIQNKRYYLSILSFFILLFFLGALSKLKDFGTDIPGVIISAYILIIIFYYIFDKKITISNEYFFIIFLLCQFALIIKISNALVFLFLFFLLFRLNFYKINFSLIIFLIFIPLPWFFQNFIISGCVIWPLTFTCISNTDLALREIYLIESFAKGDISTSMEINNLNWIYIWFSNHFSKIFETYFVYVFILFVPIIYTILNERQILKSTVNLKKIYINSNFQLILLIVILCNLIWFFNAPAYRFGIFYNLSLIMVILLPFWKVMFDINSKKLLKYSRFVLFMIFIYFIYENIIKIDWYQKRYDIWPPIINEKLIDRKNF